MQRLRSILKWGCIGSIGVIAVLLLVIAVLNWRASARREAEWAKIRAAGDPVTLADLEPEPIDPALNGATYLRRAAVGIANIHHEIGELANDSEAFYTDGRLTAEGARRVRAALQAYPDVSALLAQAADCPSYAAQLDYASEPQVLLSSILDGETHLVRGAGRVLRKKLDLQLYDGQDDEAVQTGLQIMRIGRHSAEEPLLIQYLVSVAVRSTGLDGIERVLSDGPVSPASRLAIEAELAAQDGMEGFVGCLKSEVAFGGYQLRTMFDGMPLVEHLWMYKNWESDYLQFLAAELSLGAAPHYKIEQDLKMLRARAAQGSGFVRLIDPAVKAAREAMDRVRAVMRAVRVLNALQGQGVTPEVISLDPALLGLPAEAVVDPFSGAPLLTKSTADGVRIYSVGSNLTDDGASPHAALDPGVGPAPLQWSSQ